MSFLILWSFVKAGQVMKSNCWNRQPCFILVHFSVLRFWQQMYINFWLLNGIKLKEILVTSFLNTHHLLIYDLVKWTLQPDKKISWLYWVSNVFSLFDTVTDHCIISMDIVRNHSHWGLFYLPYGNYQTLVKLHQFFNIVINFYLSTNRLLLDTLSQRR